MNAPFSVADTEQNFHQRITRSTLKGRGTAETLKWFMFLTIRLSHTRGGKPRQVMKITPDKSVCKKTPTPFEPIEPDQERPFAEYCTEVLSYMPSVRADCERETKRSPREVEPDMWTLRSGFYYEVHPRVCAALALTEEDPENGEPLTRWDDELTNAFIRAMSRKPCIFAEATTERCPFCNGPLVASRGAVDRILYLDCRAATCVDYSRSEGINPWTGTLRTESAETKQDGLWVIRRDTRAEVLHQREQDPSETIATFDAGDLSFVEVFRVAASMRSTPS